MSTSRHKWTFTSRFRVRTFGWRSSALACKRLREAVSEIKKVARKDPVLGAQGAVKLMEKIWPALEHVDSSSMAEGYGYEVTSEDVHDAYDHALNAAAELGLVEQVLRDLRKIADRDNEPARWVKRALARRLELEP